MNDSGHPDCACAPVVRGGDPLPCDICVGFVAGRDAEKARADALEADCAAMRHALACANKYATYAAGAETPGLVSTALFRSGVQALRTKAALLESLEPDASPSGPNFLEFIADRLVTHGDSPQADFVLALRRKAGKMRAALSAARENP